MLVNTANFELRVRGTLTVEDLPTQPFHGRLGQNVKWYVS